MLIREDMKRVAGVDIGGDKCWEKRIPRGEKFVAAVDIRRDEKNVIKPHLNGRKNLLLLISEAKIKKIRVGKKCYRSPPRKPGVPLASAASRRPKGAGTPGFRGGPQCSRERWVHSAVEPI